MYRYFIYLAYDGTHYHGWQIQPNDISVQQTLMDTLATFLRKNVEVTGAGRTDAGVHARLMVAHFDWEVPLNPEAVTEKMNRILPADIVVYHIRQVRPDAHARFDATYRTYRYYITTRKSPFNRQFHYRLTGGKGLDFEAMNQAAKVLFAYTDFTSFSKLHTDVKMNNCRIMQARWEQKSESEWVFVIQADRFLRNMVRAIVGTLFEVGRGKISIEGFRQIIELKDRGKAGTSAPGHALFLEDVGYPEEIFRIED